MTGSFLQLIPAILGVGFLLFVLITNLKSRPPQLTREERESQEEKGYSEESAVDPVWLQRAYTRWQRIRLVRAVAVVLILQLASFFLWFLPSTVPDHIWETAEQDIPDNLVLEEKVGEASPLQWRARHLGHSVKNETLTMEASFTYHKFKEEGEMEVFIGSQDRRTTKNALGVGLMIVAALLLWSQRKILFGRPDEKKLPG